MSLHTIQLPDELVEQAMRDTGERTARAAVVAALKAHHAERQYEPLTPEQCAQSMAKAWDKVVITPEMQAAGITPEFFRP